MISKNFKLKSYTTTVSAERSITEIEGILGLFGASAIMKEFAGDGTTKFIAFKLDNNSYKLPVNIDGIKNILFKSNRISTRQNASIARDRRAYNVAWRIIREWIHSQLSLIASGQAQPDQVMLPYLYDGERTLYEAYKDGTLKLENKSEKSQPMQL